MINILLVLIVLIVLIGPNLPYLSFLLCCSLLFFAREERHGVDAVGVVHKGGVLR